MSKVVFKYVLHEAATMMPEGAQILRIEGQHGHLCAWALVDQSAPLVRREFIIVGTGHPLPQGNFTHLGSGMLHDGNYVFHVFEAVQP